MQWLDACLDLHASHSLEGVSGMLAPIGGGSSVQTRIQAAQLVANKPVAGWERKVLPFICTMPLFLSFKRMVNSQLHRPAPAVSSKHVTAFVDVQCAGYALGKLSCQEMHLPASCMSVCLKGKTSTA